MGTIICECDCNIRFKNNSFITALLLTLGFTFSFLSDLDCFLVEVDVGFVPKNSFYKTSTFGIGLWTFEDPDIRGRCITPTSVAEVGSLTSNDKLYTNIWINEDAMWSASRITAVIGLIFGFIAMVS